MKRLLSTLLAAFALPTAVNAFPFGNDVQTVDDVGRKTLVKGSSVTTSNKTFKDLIPLIVKYLDNQIGKEKMHRSRATLTNEKKSMELYKKWKNKELIELQKYPLNKATLEVKESDKRLEKNINNKKRVITEIEEIKADETIPEIHVINVFFKPINIDLNKNKTVLPQMYYSCLNSKLKFNVKNKWRAYDLKFKEYSNDLYTKVCNKYAKF